MDDGAGRPFAPSDMQEPDRVVVLEASGGVADPVLGHHLDQPHLVDDLTRLLGHLADDTVGRRLPGLQSSAGQVPASTGAGALGRGG